MFRVLCAPDSFKETLSATDVARAMAAGIEGIGQGVGVDICPVADGGDGTLDALIGAMGGTLEWTNVRGPLGEERQAPYGLLADGRTGVVELARASGLALVPPTRRDPTRTTTYGTGQLIRGARQRGCVTLIVGIGGSATCDGGVGLTQALGGTFYDADDRPIAEPLVGGRLMDIARFELPSTLPSIRVACDVTNPLSGTTGAAAIYGPQKGATPGQVELLDAGLRHLASLTEVDPAMPGAGAAGGAAFGLVAFCGARLERGIDLVLDAVDFEGRCREADLVITGEGRLDAQTASGKGVGGVAAVADRLGVPTIAIVGSLGPGAESCMDPSKGGFLHAAVSLSERFGDERALNEPAALIAEIAREIVANMLTRGE